MRAGNYCLIQKQEPIRKFEPIASDPPNGLWRPSAAAI